MEESRDAADDDVVTRHLDTEQDAPATQIAEVVGDLDDAELTDLPPIYRCVDGLIADLFSSPPPAEAEANITFTYHGYRIHVEQDGETRFLEVSP